MKIWRLALAVTLAAGTVAAYVYFPNPMEQASRNAAPGAEHPDSGTPAISEPVAGGEST